MTIHLHLGAHKTGSTHIQATLRENAGVLAAAGIDWLPPAELRGLIGAGRSAAAAMAPVPSLRAWAAARRLARRLAREAGALTVASDENGLGQTREVIARAALYPTAAARLRLWRGPSRRRDLRVFLGIRDYGPFFAGVHAQSVRDGAAAPLSEAERRALAALPRRWPDLVADIRRALPHAALTLWRFEDYPALSAGIHSRLTGVETLAPFGRRSMATPSAPAMAAIFALAETRPDGRIDRESFARVRAETPGPRYMPFAAPEAEAMAAAYAEDVARLRADPAIEWLSP